jgi:hypothetical protein
MAGRLERGRGVLVDFGGHLLPFVTLGAAAATFRHRAARSRSALRRVGVLTTAVASIFVAVSLVNEFVLRRFETLESGYRHNSFDSIWRDLGEDTSLAIAAFWGVLALGWRWRAAPDWTDRIGRAVGAGWIAYAILGVLLRYVLPPR